MNASQPEANSEYSTGPQGSERSGDGRESRFGGPRRGPSAPGPHVSPAPRALACLGAALLAAAEFSPLLRVRTIAAHPRVVRSVQGGPHHGWSLLVIAVLAVGLALIAGRPGGRPAAVMVALLGAGALAVAIGVDLPDAHATGLIGGATPTEAQSQAAIGLYLETAGAVALLLAGGAAMTFGRGS